MTSHGIRSRLTALALVGLGTAGWFGARQLNIWTDDGPGPGLMPKVALGLVIGLGVVVALRPGDEPHGDTALERSGRITFFVYGAALLLLAAAIPYAGFILPAFVATTAVLRWAERRSWAVALVYGVTLTGAIVLMFGSVLRVQFPDGPVERMLKSAGAL